MRLPTRYNAVSALVGGGISGSSDGAEIEYHGKTPPTESAINAKLTELIAAYDAQEYARKREAEYPAIQELVVALYDSDDKAAVDAKRAAIKAKYPKPS